MTFRDADDGYARPMIEPNFDVARDDMLTIMQIVKRAKSLNPAVNGMTANMDICAAHNSCPLKLDELLAADDFNFAHDVFGIFRHIDRRSGTLQDCFLPRYAA